MLLRAIGRLILAPLAILLSLITEMWVMCLLLLQKFETSFREFGISSENFFMIWKTNSFNESWVLSLIITLFLAILILGEILHIQSLLYYSVGFGASSALFTLIAPHIEIQMFHGSQEGLWKIFITSGFAAGFVYWLVAGRTA